MHHKVSVNYFTTTLLAIHYQSNPISKVKKKNIFIVMKIKFRPNNSDNHYENMSMQYTAIFHRSKNEKNLNIFFG